jgi:hypothetical protein
MPTLFSFRDPLPKGESMPFDSCLLSDGGDVGFFSSLGGAGFSSFLGGGGASFFDSSFGCSFLGSGSEVVG